MLVGRFQSHFSFVDGLSRARTGNAMIFDTGKTSLLRCGQVRLEIVQIQIKADIPVEIAVARIARIAFLMAPDFLLSRFEIPPAKTARPFGVRIGANIP